MFMSRGNLRITLPLTLACLRSSCEYCLRPALEMYRAHVHTAGEGTPVRRLLQTVPVVVDVCGEDVVVLAPVLPGGRRQRLRVGVRAGGGVAPCACNEATHLTSRMHVHVGRHARLAHAPALFTVLPRQAHTLHQAPTALQRPAPNNTRSLASLGHCVHPSCLRQLPPPQPLGLLESDQPLPLNCALPHPQLLRVLCLRGAARLAGALKGVQHANHGVAVAVSDRINAIGRATRGL